jgi:hypothetical protein
MNVCQGLWVVFYKIFSADKRTMVTVKVVPAHAMKAYEGVYISLYSFLNSVLNRDE